MTFPMPGNIARNQVLRSLDEQLNDATKRVQHYRLRLQGTPIWDIAVEMGYADADTAEHLKTHYYGTGTQAYWPAEEWPDIGDKEEIVRLGYMRAIETAGVNLNDSDLDWVPRNDNGDAINADGEVIHGHELAIASYWVCAGSHFEVSVSRTDEQVTLLILTPSLPALPERRRMRLPRPDDTWVVAPSSKVYGYVREFRVDQLLSDDPSEKPHYYKGAPNPNKDLDQSYLVLRLMTD